MTHPSRVRSGAWLALFAMLLLLAGPLLSQGLAQARATPAMAGMEPMAGMEHMDCGEHGARAPGPAKPADHMAPDEHWAKCGYCTLLFNSPALTATGVAALAAAAPIDTRPVAPLAEGHAGSAIFPGARTRAPPASN